MLVLFLRTDKPESELYVYDGDTEIGSVVWHAHRVLANTIHVKIQELLQSVHKDIHMLERIVVYEGPGSFTGLRIGISVANALASGLNVPIVGVTGDSWRADGLRSHDSKTPIQPVYGRDPHITQPRK